MDKEEAMKILKDFHDKSALFSVRTALDTIIPELKESEDEKIRREIIYHIKNCDDTIDEETEKRMLAWLEKQGELVNSLSKGLDNAHERIDELIQKNNKLCIKLEQKPAWSEEDENTIKVLMNIIRKSEIIDSIIYTDSLKEKLYDWLKSLRPQPKQEWSEEDRDYYDAIIAKLEVTQDDAALTDNQMEFLKSLKGRVRPKKEWNKEDEKMIGRLRNIVEKYAFSHSAVDVNGELCEKEYIEADNWLKSFKDKVQLQSRQGWSEEDERIIHNIDAAIRHEVVFPIDELKSMKIWLESLKYRIRPKHEWKKDEKMFQLIEDVIDVYRKTQGSVIGGVHTEELKDYLKSLKPQNTWKPSIAQLNALSIVSKGNAPDDIEAIVSLYNDLKKLRGE